jgi:hypothetical protein
VKELLKGGRRITFDAGEMSSFNSRRPKYDDITITSELKEMHLLIRGT